MDTGSAVDVPRRGSPPVVVVGNSKGGTGKSTIAVHLAIGLLYKGYEVGVLDLDPDQGTITRYLANRRSWRSLDGAADAVRRFPMPRQAEPAPARALPRPGAAVAARQAVDGALAELSDCDIVVVDTPGGPSALSRAGHECADVLVTPINDSFVDIDVLAEIDAVSRTVVAPSRYSVMVLEIGDRRRAEGREPLDWLVIRNRQPHVYSRNRRDIDRLMSRLGERLGFRQVAGLGERVAFREHFQTGLTMLDLVPAAGGGRDRASAFPVEDAISQLIDAVIRGPGIDSLRGYAAPGRRQPAGYPVIQGRH